VLPGQSSICQGSRPCGFTGELADANGLLYLRARHYAPRLGTLLRA
jgi:hypothetical protein